MDLIPRRFFLDDFFDDFGRNNMTNNLMKCDIYEKDNCYVIEMDAPGFTKEDININVDNGYLTISSSKSEEKEDNSKNYIRRERRYGSYERQFYIGDIDEANIKATFQNGILQINVPKKEEIATKRTIEIE